MTLKTFSTGLDEVLGLVEPAVTGIKQGQGAAELLKLEELLRRALVDLLRLIRRDPGIEAATWDLYGAAVALVRDHGAGELPMAESSACSGRPTVAFTTGSVPLNLASRASSSSGGSRPR